MTETNSDEMLVKWRVASSNVQRLQEISLTLNEQIAQLEQSLKDWNGAKTLLEYLKNYKLEKRKDFILGIINSALKDIFESNYRLDIQPRETKGKSAASVQKYDIIFYQNDIEIARNDELLTSNGGGVLSIASLFFKILIGYLYSKNKFYIFDEALSQVSPQYRGRLSKFLKVFCEKYGFTLVVVSQTEELEEHAHLVYEVNSAIDEKDVPVLLIDSVQGEFPKEDFFYSNIRNFQSIKDQTFIFKGFTIIRGPNNSGKSASLRAIEAILFNNFKVDTYPRKNPGGKKLTTEITFGFQGEEGTLPKEIGLKYKSSKVMFVIDGEEYFGKNLAADKLKEAVEEIGFRYIDVKSMYKNFKGDLKDQTERIAYTNQHDGLFLIGAKTSDSEKIFSFLFNTENIALAIAQAKEKILQKNNLFKDLSHEINELQEKISSLELKYKYFNYLYYKVLIDEFFSIKNNIETYSNQKTIIEEAVAILTQKIELEKSIDFIERYSITKESIASKIQKLDLKIKITDIENFDLFNKYISSIKVSLDINNKNLNNVQELIKRYNGLSSINIYDEFQSKIDSIKKEINPLEKIIPYYIYGSLIDNYFIVMNTLEGYQKNIDAINMHINNLNTEYQIETCPRCNGVGYISKE
jgi:energy-coupling factor transporter ATP-binding protein EcfA2